MAYDHHKGDKHDKHGKDVDVDVEVDAELKLDIEVEKESKEFKEDIEVKKEFKTDIEFKKEDVEVKKDVEVDVDKDVDVDVWKVHVNVESESINDATDNDVNDIDSQKLIDVGPEAILKMDDFAVRNLAIGKSFNGSGNDSQYSVTQSNDLKDNDTLIAPAVTYFGLGGNDGNGPYSPDFSFPGHGGKDGDSPFQKVEADGGKAKAGDGTGGDSEANENGANGSVSGEAIASADGIANVEAFTQDILMGGNQQANFATFDVVGGDGLQANDIKGQLPADAGTSGANGETSNGGEESNGGVANRNTDDDVNDLDAQELIDVDPHSALFLDDFRLDTVAIGESFNGPGNDMQFDVVQVNDMVDNDFLYRPEVKYIGPSGTPFQDVKVEGGDAESGDGTGGQSTANNNGLDGSVSGSTIASADAVANVSAFTQNIVMGANLQVNNMDATVVGGNSIVADNVDLTS